MKNTEWNWHTLNPEQAAAALETDGMGLSDAQAQERLRTFGPNQLATARPPGALMRFLRQFHNILIYVLLAAALLTAFFEHYVDTGVILAVVLVNALIGFWQEGQAESSMQAIRRLLAPKAAVVRGGKRRSLPAEELVPGDIVLLEAGDKVPADLRLLEANALTVEEAILTGESVPVVKQTESVGPDAPLGDRTCMAYSGTLVASGQARGLVVATGARTEIGRISTLLGQVEELATPLTRQMNDFGRWLTWFILTFAGLLLVFSYFVRHYDFAEVFMVVVGLSVAAIPEGLPAVLSITLALGVQAMARRNAIVRRLPAIETIGSVSVICTDKTGTLTRNEMVVASAVMAGGTARVEGLGYAPQGSIHIGERPFDRQQDTAWLELGRAALLCNDASLSQSGGSWRVEGDPMEGALLAFAGKMGLESAAETNARPRLLAIPFDPRNRYMATLHADPAGGFWAMVKGAPERVLDMCRSQRTPDGGLEALDPAYWNKTAETTARRGQRVLAFAVRRFDEKPDRLTAANLDGHLTLVGLVGLIDPPRPEAIEAVEQCHRAGIQVKMITGDHAGTAAAIGREIGLRNPENVLTGANLDQLDDDALASAVRRVNIFARTSPEHKLRLVMALQAHNLTVAMTGDGVNDAPALKRADVGIAMGQKGSEAAKEASDLVLADDNFASIAAAVREGRTVYDNLKKVISWTLPTNAAEALTIVLALLAGLTLPITPVQILWVNMITAVSLGIALAYEPTEAGTMHRPPRPRNEPLLDGKLVWHIILVSTLFLGGVFGLFAYAQDRGYSLELSRTIAVNALVAMEVFHLFFIRNIYQTSLRWELVRGTPVVWFAVGIVALGQLVITYVPAAQALMGTEAMPVVDGLLVLGTGVALFALVELEKQLRLR